jgi:hypothetical protein
VIEGGDLDINFEVFDPNNKRLIHAVKSSDESHELEIKLPGIYSFCIDNSFSSITPKMVYLDLGITREDEELGRDHQFETVFNVYVSTFFCCFEFLFWVDSKFFFCVLRWSDDFTC